MNRTPLRVSIGIVALTLLCTALSLLLRWPLWPVMGQKNPFLTFLPSVILSAYLGGLWPGLLATFLSAAAADYFTRELIRILADNDVSLLGANFPG